MSSSSSAATYPALYMVLWERIQTEEIKDPYHTGLLYVPSAPNPPPKKGEKAVPDGNVTRLHLNYVSNVWSFKEEDTRRKTSKMKSACYLGTLTISKDDLIKKLKAIELKQNQTDWRCHDWTFKAIEVLSADKSLESQPNGAKALWTDLQDKLTKAQAKNAHAFVTTNKKGEVLKKSGIFND